jgi:hypothetical protein
VTLLGRLSVTRPERRGDPEPAGLLVCRPRRRGFLERCLDPRDEISSRDAESGGEIEHDEKVGTAEPPFEEGDVVDVVAGRLGQGLLAQSTFVAERTKNLADDLSEVRLTLSCLQPCHPCKFAAGSRAVPHTVVWYNLLPVPGEWFRRVPDQGGNQWL